jgi:hypothetical protein
MGPSGTKFRQDCSSQARRCEPKADFPSEQSAFTSPKMFPPAGTREQGAGLKSEFRMSNAEIIRQEVYLFVFGIRISEFNTHRLLISTGSRNSSLALQNEKYQNRVIFFARRFRFVFMKGRGYDGAVGTTTNASPNKPIGK